MKIRFAEEKDLSSIIELCKAHAQYERSSFKEENKKEQLSKHILNPDSEIKCLIAESNTEIIGYATFFRQFSTWDAGYYMYVDCLFLKENARGNGTGKQIMELIKSYSKEQGCPIIQWQTPGFNRRAIKFYTLLGAERKNKERFFWKV
ncbi:putative acetyltransferase [Chryseobacterium gleum]|uniref:Acetyltransferase, GNAT family n=2 Tax=Chryseobacterium gleum TaxID=250 RepID=A0ABN0AXW5_CHRGE|nr:GNAT family N-acetyltransferase [Chryseobacterium gleum]EFK37961.1 acetyltransferase, GNAT family [Chryseobacterium gleum ATCC 35910]QQY32583.1 GNAT family N-acetyltransferase [Chryseobacterium gleum]VEE10197.1 putative acetyltransferase [Chryseobacterium gleum]